MRAYIVMSYYASPIAFTEQKPKEVFTNAKAAKDRVKELTKKAQKNMYYVISVPLIES